MKKNPKLEGVRKKLYSGNRYRCPSCGAIVERTDKQGKKWYESWCLETGKEVHMMLVKPKKK